MPTLKLSASVLEKITPKLGDMLKQQSPEKKSKETDAKNKKLKNKKDAKPKKQQQQEKRTIEDALQRRDKTLRWLCSKYPLCFNKQNPVPLKIGVNEDIFAILPKYISRGVVRKALAHYTRLSRYLNALVSNSNRYNLNGEIVGTISEKERDFAQMKIDSFADANAIKEDVPDLTQPSDENLLKNE